MKRLSAVLFSMVTTSCLLLIFAIGIAYATFIENDYGTQTAQILIYDAVWFEVLLSVTAINLVGSLFYYKALKLKRWSMVLFHLAFILMLVGAGVTRFFSYEGSIHIREGELSNQLISTQSYIQLKLADEQGNIYSDEWPVSLSPYTNNSLNKDIRFQGKEFNISLVDYVPNGELSVVADETGGPMVELIVLDNGSRRKVILSDGETQQFTNFALAFGRSDVKNAIQIKRSGPGLVVVPLDTMQVVEMDGQEQDPLLPGNEYPLSSQYMLKSGDDLFVLNRFVPNGRKALKANGAEEQAQSADALLFQVGYGRNEKMISVEGMKGLVGVPLSFEAEGCQVSLSYGSKIIELPFQLKLRDFQLERYPGSMSPSSFASEVTVLDSENKVEMPFRIFMNNILDYGGYRFFQSSYDQDEKGTVLSVSYDRAGTMLTYWGYFLMTIGMLFTFINKKSRFQFLLRSASRIKEMKQKTLVLLLLILLTGPSVVQAQATKVIFNPEHVSQFDQLLVQDRSGRVEPLNTLASEILRKLYRKSAYNGLSASEVLLGMSAMPEAWKNEPIIKVSNSELENKLNIKGGYASFNQLVDMNRGVYLLRELVNEAYQKKATSRNKFDKEVINIDERINISFQVFKGDFLRVFPDRDDQNKTWYAEPDYLKISGQKGMQAEALMTGYLDALKKALNTGDYSDADRELNGIIAFQHENGSDLILSPQKVKLEVLYNKLNIFNLLFKVCAFLGILMLLIHLVSIFNVKQRLKTVLFIGNWLLFAVFLFYSAGLALRWYISGHAPWSNSYETLLYIGWATLLSGFILLRKSQITLAVTSILTSLILMVASMSWLNPEITNLVPVLKSYWLIIHVAVITASYGFLGIAALLGLLNLILMIFRTPKNIQSISYAIIEIAIVIELAMIIGLVLLTVGAFIGGVWANESWGRYWGWDPKETWALVTILVYSFILHLRKVPGLYNHFLLSLFAVVGYSAVLMTFFGVNYYLSGMHSYGQGDPPPVPSGVYWAIGVIVAVGVGASISQKKMGRPEDFLKIEEE